MPGKVFTLDNGQTVTIYKRRASRNVRLTIAPEGGVRISIPAWAPYKTGLAFAQSRQDWIAEQIKPAHLLVNGQAVGKAHHLLFTQVADKQKPTSRVLDTTIIIRCPLGMEPTDPEAQKVAQTACIKALRSQAEQLLPQRLATLAEQHGFTYTDVTVKRLKGRWGSCDHEQHIVLNLYLMQLPWELIDYVLLHELTHTQILRHGSEFWEAMARVLPAVKARRKQMRQHQPVLA